MIFKPRRSVLSHQLVIPTWSFGQMKLPAPARCVLGIPPFIQHSTSALRQKRSRSVVCSVCSQPLVNFPVYPSRGSPADRISCYTTGKLQKSILVRIIARPVYAAFRASSIRLGMSADCHECFPCRQMLSFEITALMSDDTGSGKTEASDDQQTVMPAVKYQA